MNVQACLVAFCCSVAVETVVSAEPILGGARVPVVMSADAGPAGSPRLLSPSLVSITYCCLVGDEFKVYDFGLPILAGSLDLPLARLFPFVIRTVSSGPRIRSAVGSRP
jgi:hypothetical protein